jgi:hypothetical protein
MTAFIMTSYRGQVKIERNFTILNLRSKKADLSGEVCSIKSFLSALD